MTVSPAAQPSSGGVSPRLPMVEMVEHLLAGLSGARLVLDTPDAAATRERRERVASQVRNHLLPRLRQVSAPVIVVLGGPTGAGKSTLVNSVLGDDVSAAGVLRPTTKEPILVAHPKDAELLADHPVLGLARLVEHERVTRGVAILDAPDLDSVSDANRALAGELVELADLWVFVTTGSRYGDAVPWTRLTEADERGVSLAVVLNRVDPAALVAVRGDLFGRMNEHGFGNVPYFVIADVGPHEGVLPTGRVAEFAGWLEVLGRGAQSRSIIARTVRGAWPALRQDVLAVAGALEVQRRTHLSLTNEIGAATAGVGRRARDDVRAGAIGYGAPTTTWLAAATSGGPLAALANPPRGAFEHWRARRSAQARAAALAALRRTCDQAARDLLTDAAGRGARAIRDALVGTGPGEQVLGRLRRGGTEREARMRTLLTEWTAQVDGRARDLVSRSETLPPASVADLVAVAAVGLDGPRRAVGRYLGDAGLDVVDELRGELAEWAEATVRAEAEAYLEALDSLDVDDPSAATSLRLRASELKGFA
ncbi:MULTISPECIES: hypothetical protein [unclassified Pseudactinotalea]|uniref:hypothetical protein n=1 Tax=unclassified Pseudactinotalea TaxID=2649176 RepID=UPI00128D4070|nr:MULTISPECIES: hypothetical protein [unclassified Pseudactinotalea]MPV50282.1 hypothetical protein [Pseudactinotalea sp. HY160]QGH70136.1 hypothetical protein GCE65_11910 [Pseudactinotalea sp. HY158]